MNAQQLVLVADDNEDNRLIFGAMLRHLGYQALEASSGEEALTLARTHHPAIVVTDLRMPGINGDELLRQLKLDPQTADLPVIVVTADSTYTKPMAREAGFCARVTKPIFPRDLARAVQHCLAHWSKDDPWVEIPWMAAV
jgi:CheY-like chemotaxis protein